MLRALAKFCREQNIPCEVSLESVMGCGIGICYGCSIEVNAPDGGTETILLCREGAVINAERLVL
jgi:dihydroorotate dehydrogenase electron transfer subunit